MDLKEKLEEAQIKAVRSWLVDKNVNLLDALRLEQRKIIHEKLRGIELYLRFSTKDEANILKEFCDEGMIDYDFIEQDLKYAVYRRAGKDYGAMLKLDEKPAHFGHPKFLAYVMEQGEFTEEQINKIPSEGFVADEGGYTREIFLQEYREENLLSELRERLLHPEPSC